VQAASYADSRPIAYHKAFKDCGAAAIERMPSEFTSLDEATIYWELVMRRLMHFITTSMAPNIDSKCGDIRNAAPGGKGGIMNTNLITDMPTSLPTDEAVIKLHEGLGFITHAHQFQTSSEHPPCQVDRCENPPKKYVILGASISCKRYVIFGTLVAGFLIVDVLRVMNKCLMICEENFFARQY
jgi:hypothetical protein